MSDDERDRSRDGWARLRFAVVGPLLASPPRRGELQEEIARLAETSWQHPRTGEPVRFGRSTIERWLAAARASRDPLAALGRAVRRDVGAQPSVSLALRQLVRQQYEEHPGWTVRLHHDNLLATSAVPEHQACQVIGEILYWRFRDPEEPADSQRFAKLWARISGVVSDAAADVLYQLTHLDWRVEEGGRAAVDLIPTFPGQIRPIVENCLAHRESLPSLFGYKGAVDSSTIRFLIGTLGRIADPVAMPTLEQIADDLEFGRDAIQAIESIQKRTMTQQMARGQ